MSGAAQMWSGGPGLSRPREGDQAFHRATPVEASASVAGVNGWRVSPPEGAEPTRPTPDRITVCRAIGCGKRPWRAGLCTRHASGTRPPADGHAWVECWCTRSVVEIPLRLIGFTTGSCGHPRCTEETA